MSSLTIVNHYAVGGKCEKMAVGTPKHRFKEALKRDCKMWPGPGHFRF
jgi:hypothetical protein